MPYLYLNREAECGGRTGAAWCGGAHVPPDRERQAHGEMWFISVL